MSSPQPITHASTRPPSAEWPFTARAAELSVLESMMGAAGSGRPSGAVIVAPAGVGKSRLLREAFLGAERNGVPHHRAIATRAARASPYGALSHLAPGAGAHQHDDPAAWYRAFAEALATDGVHPLLAIDDAHLLDNGSAALILHLALSGSATVLVTIRRGESVPDPLTTLWKDGLVDRIDLQPLSHAEMCQAIAAGLGDAVSTRTLDQLAQVSNGNLLFARELVLAAIDAGGLEHRGGAWRWDEEIVLAPRLRDTVRHRLGDLAQSERDALGILALGEPMAFDQLAGLTDPTTLTGLERGGLIETDAEGAWRVGHPLYGEVVLAELGKVRTAALSRRLIEVLDGPDLAPAEMARLATWQLDLGDRPDPEILAEAAVLANRAFDHRLAERLARSALLQGQNPVAAVALAHACNGQDRYAEAEQVLAAAETAVLASADDAVRLRYLDRRHTALYLGLGRRADAVAVLDRAVASHPRPEVARTDPFLALAHGLRAQSALDDGQLSRVVDLNEAALAEPENAGGLGLLLALETTAEAHAYAGRIAAARALHARMMELAATGEPEVRRGASTAVLQECLCLTLEGKLDQALAIAEQIQQQVVAEPDTRIRSLVALVLGGIQLQRGTADAARRTLLDAVDGFAAADSGGAASWSAAMLAQAEALLGNVAGARAALSRSEELRLVRPISRMQVDFVLAEATTRAAAGDVTGAVRVALAPPAGWDELVIRRVQLLHRSIGMGAPTAAVLDELAAIARRVDAPLVGSMLDHATALAHADPAGLLEVADWFEATGMLLAAAEASAQASAILRDAGRTSEAGRARARARRLGDACEGAHTPTLDRATVSTGPVATLSRREREVAELAAAGLGNAEIADQLVLSVRTVESHLYRAFAKLGVERREDITAALAPGQLQ